MPLFGFLFASPFGLLLTGAGAVSIPIIIHLLNRKRFRVVDWAAMRFLLAAQRKNARKMRLEQLILLVVRCLIVLLLALALTAVTPWAEAVWQALFPGAASYAVSTQRTHKVIVLDGSFSMALRVGDKDVFDRARRAAEQVIHDSPSGDAFSVVLMASSPRRVVGEPAEDGRKVAAELQGLRLPHGNADVAGTLNAVEAILRQSPAKFVDREVYFITDLQQATWLGDLRPTPEGSGASPPALTAVLQKIQERARTVLVDVGQEVGSNLAVTRLGINAQLATTTGATPITAVIQNYGPDAKEQVHVRLLVGKARAAAPDAPLETRLAQEMDLKLGRGGNTVTFPYKFTSPGEYVIQVRLGTDDAPADDLAPDDVRSAVVTVKDQVPVMLVNGKVGTTGGGKLTDEATEWLRFALNPARDEVVPGPLPTKPKVVGEKEFDDAGLGDLTPYDCVFLCDVKQLTPPEVRRLETHVRQGGGVVFFLGDQVDLRAYNDALYRGGNGLLPARLVAKQSAAANTYFHFGIDERSYRLPPLDAFTNDDDRVGLTTPRFRQYVRTESLGKGARKVISFLPASAAAPGTPPPKELEQLPVGDAAVVEWLPLLPPAGKEDANNGAKPFRARGRVVLITTTANMDWGTWPAYRSYLPFMKELLGFGVSGRLREQARTVGEPLEEFLSITGGGIGVQVQTPDGRTEAAQTEDQDEVSLFRWHDTDVSGVYRAAVGQHPREYVFAVNVPTASDGQEACESDPARTTADELHRAYPGWDFQLVTDLKDVKHGSPDAATVEVATRSLGPDVARVLVFLMILLLLTEAVLTWLFGHYSSAAGAAGPTPSGWLLPGLMAAFAGIVTIVIAVVLLHALVSGDFLGFLGEGPRRAAESWMGMSPPASGEGISWQPEADPFWAWPVPGLGDTAADPWLARFLALLLVGLPFLVAYRPGEPWRLGPLLWVAVGGMGVLALLLILLAGMWPAAVAAVVLTFAVGTVYLREGPTASPAYKLLLAGIRGCLLLLVLAVLLPQFRVHFVHQSWPDVAVIVDDSQSMSVTDEYHDPQVKAVADRLAQEGGLTQPERLGVARVLVAGEKGLMPRLLGERQLKVHVYHCSNRVHRLADVTGPEHLDEARKQLAGVTADAKNDGSRLGAAVRQVLNDFRGGSLAAVVLLSDGVTTEGEDLVKVSAYARQVGVPLYLVGVGDAREQRDLYLHDLQCEDAVYTNDRVVFEVRLTGQGYTDLTVPVRLREKGKEDKVLKEERVTVDPQGKPVKVRLVHQPTEPGEKVYIIDVPVQPDETHADNNRVERTVLVRDVKLFKVLYVEGYARYEYRFVKTLLERESARLEGNKSIDLKVLLLDADPGYAAIDKSALAEFPDRTQLNGYDVVILGDVDPKDPKLGDKRMGELADFVRERGGGLLVLAGERNSPHSFRNTPLADVLPIEVLRDKPQEDVAAPRTTGFRPELTPAGRLHPVFRFDPSEKENEDVWNHLREMYWWADGYRAKPAAEVLAVHPKAKLRPEDRPPSGEEGLPLVVQHFFGAGRCMFFGFAETWRWRFREDELRFNQFWVQTVRHLARSRLGRVELRVDRQTPYQRGEPIKVTVRFPDDQPPPDPGAEVKVIAERRPPRKPGTPPDQAQAGPPIEVQTLKLTRSEASRSAFEGLLTRTPEGEYLFWLSVPVVAGPKPKAEARVLAPPGEMEVLRMNQADLERAAEESQGHFYTLATAERVVNDVPPGNRVSLNPSGPPWQMWAEPAAFVFAVLLLTFEWVLRKRKHLL